MTYKLYTCYDLNDLRTICELRRHICDFCQKYRYIIVTRKAQRNQRVTTLQLAPAPRKIYL